MTLLLHIRLQIVHGLVNLILALAPHDERTRSLLDGLYGWKIAQDEKKITSPL